MNLPRRQQAMLDQIEQSLQAADPRLKSLFSTFNRAAKDESLPATEVLASRFGRLARLPRRTVVVCLVVISMVSVLVVGIRATSGDCPGLSSDQAVAGAAVRYAACSKATDAWSRGGR
jgi:Protein of unknown function (DUF3040)